MAATKLFIELTWAEAGAVIAGAVLAAKAIVGVVRSMAATQRANRERQKAPPGS